MSEPSSAVRSAPAAVNGWNADYLDQQYLAYRADPNSLPSDVRAFFQGFELAGDGLAPGGQTPQSNAFDRAVEGLVEAYWQLGHLAAAVDPFDRAGPAPAELTLEYHSLTQADLGRRVNGGTLADLVARLRRNYCGSIGFEFLHAATTAEREWFSARIEEGPSSVSKEEADRILLELTQSETFERFLDKRYKGKKRFSLEGGESLIPLLKAMTERAGTAGVREIILGMAHRGRLNVLRNYVGKVPGKLVTEFEDSWVEGRDQSGGDVKYHRGYSGDQALPGGGSVHLSMLNNPSHLESVNPVVLGRCRARQEAAGADGPRRYLPLLIHGDAAVAGQGVVAECLNMANLPGYTVGGTIHVVINNLVGFTTDPSDGRSTVYCTDIAKMINAPVMHVNGNDPEAAVRAARLAVEYRQQFGKDVFIDLVCFRKHGHNEQDEPSYTQPGLYALVKQHPGVREMYARRLVETGVITAERAAAMVDQVQAELDEAQTSARAKPVKPVPPPGGGAWEGFQGTYSLTSPPTAVPASVIEEICTAIGRPPEGFNVHPKLRALVQSRAELPKHGRISHADAELLAVATLLLDGVPVRLSGQDCRRGTFTQRHAVLRDEQTGAMWTPVNGIRDKQAKFSVWDSPLSEFGVMGFDFGYSRAAPRTLVMWEAQFGDFVNSAQVMIDQYLASSEVKWDRWAGLTLLLPHGYEGQGPEHSSARLERFLQLCADENMEVVYPTTGGQMFHLLRRQAMRNFRKPLIVMTPKKYLRIETSDVTELSEGAFQHIIDDPAVTAQAAKSIARVIYCSGKVYHDLADRCAATGRKDIALVRIEQLYPFHATLARQIDARYPRTAERVWVQEEPRNQGAYLWIADVFRRELKLELAYIGRAPSASPAAGSESIHKREHEAILSEAVGPAPSADKTKSAAGAHDTKAGGLTQADAKPADKSSDKAARKSRATA